MSSTWKPQEWGMSVSNSCPQTSGRNMSFLSFHRANRELSLSLWSVFSHMMIWPWNYIEKKKKKPYPECLHLVMTCGGHPIMSGSWEGIRRQEEKDEMFLSINEKKIKSSHRFGSECNFHNSRCLLPQGNSKKTLPSSYELGLWKEKIICSEVFHLDSDEEVKPNPSLI